MGAPVILIEKLVGGDETHLALTRLQQVLASGVCDAEGGRKGNEKVRVKEETCNYFDGSSFCMYMAEEEDLKKVDTSSVNIPLVRIHI